MKKILLLVIGIIVGSVVGIKASELILSSQVIYKDNETIDVALDNLFDELMIGKEKMAAAITGKGIETSKEDSLSIMASNVEQLNLNTSSTIEYYNYSQANTSTTLSTGSTLSTAMELIPGKYILITQLRSSHGASYYSGQDYLEPSVTGNVLFSNTYEANFTRAYLVEIEENTTVSISKTVKSVYGQACGFSVSLTALKIS